MYNISMKKILILLMLLLSPLFSQSITANYDVSFGIFGEIGKSDITYVKHNGEYLILIHAWTTGMSATLSQNRNEEYISQGKIINGVLRPDVFVKFRRSDRATKIALYTFDHINKKIFEYKSKEHEVYSTEFDVHTMKNIDVTSEEFSSSEEEFRLYTQNDLLSLFFNTQSMLPTLQEGDSKQYTAIGSKRDDCIIDIAVPNRETREELQAVMPDNEGKFITITIHQNIFQSKNGELYVNFDSDGFAKDVLLRDVIMFGDIRGKRIQQNENLAETLSTICL
jgi:hypothetical protein